MGPFETIFDCFLFFVGTFYLTLGAPWGPRGPGEAAGVPWGPGEAAGAPWGPGEAAGAPWAPGDSRWPPVPKKRRKNSTSAAS